ncbi:MAG: C10 family peptidase, partial [Bacteroidetes bacterium]|nr:C10 family peptidase [Bacteroidota bacterium]
FVIVGASKDYYPVLAYSEENTFEYNEEIGGLVIWMEETQEAIRQSENSDEDTKSQMRNLWTKYEPGGSSIIDPVKTRASDPAQEAAFQSRISELQNDSEGSEYSYYRLSDVFYEGVFADTYGAYLRFCSMANEFGSPLEYTIVGIKNGYHLDEVGPLLSTHWHQTYPFNASWTTNPDKVIGCITVAMAQIMKCHQWPTSLSFNGIPIYWNNMPNTGSTTYPNTHSTPTLMWCIRELLDSPLFAFIINETAANAKNAFQDFGYNSYVIDHNATTVKSELLVHQNPVMMTGYTGAFLGGIPTGTGHAWVCDGARYDYAYHRYFMEFLYRPGGIYDYTNIEDTPSLESPYGVNGGASLFFHMNWGGGGSSDNTWYISNHTLGPNGSNYSHYRRDVYASIP